MPPPFSRSNPSSNFMCKVFNSPTGEAISIACLLMAIASFASALRSYNNPGEGAIMCRFLTLAIILFALAVTEAIVEKQEQQAACPPSVIS